MMKTRRKSKAATVDHDDEAGPSHDDAHPLSVSLPDDVDQEVLSQLFPNVDITSPSQDAIISFYRLFLAQHADLDNTQRELDDTRAEVEKKDIELDQALQDKESVSKEFEASLEAASDEMRQIKLERDQLLEAKNSLQVQITELSTSKSSSSEEVENLKHRVDDTEREKRDLVGVISRLKQETAQREEEIHTLRSNLKEARQEHQALEAQVRELRSTETSTKFKLDSLTQQLELSQAEANRTNVELLAKTEDFAKYRRTNHVEMANLQSSFDSLTQTHASTQSSLKALQSAHTAQTHQLTQALAKVQGLTGQLAEQEAKYSIEASGLRRLVGMMEEREKQAKEIVEGIEREWASVGERAEQREAALRADVEREAKRRDQAEARVEQLENLMQRMGRGELPMPGTPMRTPGPSDSIADGMMGLSPTVAMASKAQRTGKTFTEVYAEYVRLQEDYAKKTAEYNHMDRTLSAVLAQIEERAPILSQQRAEYERLQSEASQLASQLSQALAERDAQANAAQENAQKLSKSTSENDLLQKQLGDLGRQVQSLLREITRRNDPTIPPDDELENVAAVPAEDISSLITHNLVAFKSITGIQEQNQKLLRIVRELGAKMESEERDYREAMEREQGEAVREAHEAMQELAAQLERQKKSSESVIQAYMKERDTLRSMVARAEKAGGSAEHVVANGIGNGPAIQSDIAKELAEVQGQFDAYRMEMGVDAGRLREDLVVAQREVSQLGAALAKANAKIEYLSDRHQMHQEQFQLHGRELDDLTKRNQQLFDQWTRVDVECSRVTEDLQISNGRVEQLRNECANLRAEKKIWESVQGRLVEENRTLAMERSHLSDLMGNVQKMHNDLERSGENDRRRLENQLQMLEGQTQDLRTQLSQERDAVRQLSLQKDIEAKELQNRLDKMVSEVSKTREALVGAETSKKHLEQRVEELNKRLQGNEEKLAVYERRTTAASGPIQSPDHALSREQQLEAEVAELRSTLKVTEVDLATARSHVQQFQEISQASEAALANLNATFDQYKESTEAQFARHESDYKALEEKFRAGNEELALLKTQHNELQKTIEAERVAWTNDKKTLEDAIVDMTTSEKHSENDRTSREQEVRQLEERAKAAEERYSHEVVVHAESIKAIETLKHQLNTAQTQARDSLATSETSQAKLATSETSWNQQKDALDKEISDLNARCQDLSTQNSILHQHLESVSSQAARIRQAADSSSVSTEGDSADNEAAKLTELRSVVSYLRKEKEIVDLQLELSKQENARLKTQIEHLSQSLQEARTTISEEREKALESAASASQHAELVERINQMNILRESNATLRADCEIYQKKSRDLEAKLKKASAELDPVKEQARNAQAELQASIAQVQRLEQESRSWQERNTQLLSKYDRIDPAEVQALKDEISSLNVTIKDLQQQKTDLEQADSNKDALLSQKNARIEALEANFRSHRDNYQKTSAGYKQKLGELNGKVSQIAAEKKLLEAKVAELEGQNSSLQAASSTVRAETASGDLDQTSVITALQEERDKLLAEKASWIKPSGNTAPSSEAPSSWEAEKAELIKTRDEALHNLKTATLESQKSGEDVKNIRFSNEKLQSRIADMTKARATNQERAAELQAGVVSEAVEKARLEWQSQNQSSTPQLSADLQRQHAEELRLLREELSAKYQADLQIAVDSAVQAALKDKPATTNVDQKAIIDAAIAEHEKALQARHAEEIASAVDRGRLEQAAKGKLKDSQLVKAQKRVKELEAQMHEWQASGIVPPLLSTLATATPQASTSQTVVKPPPTPVSTTPQAQTLSQTPVKVATTPTNATALPRRPTLTPGAPGAPSVPIRGGARGRGGPPAGRAGAPTRVAPVKPSPAAAPAAAAAASAAAASTAGGMSIMGAASKRPREDGSQSGDDSLAKRLKPEQPAAKPVQIRRPPPT